MLSDVLIELLKKHRINDVKVGVPEYEDDKPEDYYDTNEPDYLIWDITGVVYDPDSDSILIRVQ